MKFADDSLEILQLLCNHAGVGLWNAVLGHGRPFDPESHWSWSAEFRRLLGFTTEDAFPDVYWSWSDRLHPDDAERTIEALHLVVADPGPVSHYDINFRLRHANGSYRWFRAVGGCVHDEAGVATRICGSLIDIHDAEAAAAANRSRTEQELARLVGAHKASQERLHQIASTSPDSIVFTDENGVVTFWNESSRLLYGFSQNEILGRHVDMILAPDWQVGEQFEAIASTMIGRTVEYGLRHRDGTTFNSDVSTSSWMEGERRCFGFIGRDARERKAREARLSSLALLDPLTGLANRVFLRQRIEDLLARDAPFAVLMIDLDGFKEVNDTLGHESGDVVLRVVGERMLGGIGANDILARFGGDEFALVVADGPERSADLAERLIATVSRPIPIEDTSVLVGASIGIALAPENGRDATGLLSSADAALYAAKASGRGRPRLFQPDLRQAAAELSACRRQLREAVEAAQFELFFQPQYEFATHRLTGAEALLRWHHPEKGLVAPDQFLPVLEKSPLAREVGDWVVREACRQAVEWRRSAPHLRVAVNLFASQLADPELHAKMAAVLRDHDLPGEALEIEIPETLQLGADPELMAMLAKLKAEGVGIAFDDYGTGYASLSSLRDLPLTRLKIDRRFVSNIVHSPADEVVMEAILLLGRRLGLAVIAEGVETGEQERRLHAYGCMEGQGYLFGRPMPAAEFEKRFFGASATTRQAA